MPDQHADPDGAEPIYTVLNKQDMAVDQTAPSVGSHNALENSLPRARNIDGPQVAHSIIDLKYADVDAIWNNHRLPGLLDLYWDRASKACLRLQVYVNIRRHPDLGYKLKLYLFIPPELIQKLTCEQGTTPFGIDTQILELVLSRPPFLVLPGQAWEPRDDLSKMATDLFYNLAGQMQFTLCVKIPGHMSSSNLSIFCTAASASQLSMYSERADPKRLYGGHGTTIEGDTMSDCVTAAGGIMASIETDFASRMARSQGAPAPEYSEPSPVLNSAPAYSKSLVTSGYERKRRRLDTSSKSAVDSNIKHTWREQQLET